MTKEIHIVFQVLNYLVSEQSAQHKLLPIDKFILIILAIDHAAKYAKISSGGLIRMIIDAWLSTSDFIGDAKSATEDQSQISKIIASSLYSEEKRNFAVRNSIDQSQTALVLEKRCNRLKLNDTEKLKMLVILFGEEIQEYKELLMSPEQE